MYTHYDNELQLCHLSTRYWAGDEIRTIAEDDATNEMVSADDNILQRLIVKINRLRLTITTSKLQTI